MKRLLVCFLLLSSVAGTVLAEQVRPLHCEVVRRGVIAPEHVAKVRSSENGRVSYVGFDSVEYLLWPVTGLHVQFLVPDRVFDSLSLAERRDLLDRSDSLYELLRSLTGFEPEGAGPLVIAVIPGQFGGRAYLGAPRIEIDEEQFAFVLEDLREPRSPVPPMIRHEMIHTFDAFIGQIGYLPDSVHQLTDLLEYYLDGYLNVRARYMGPDASRDARERFRNYLADPGANSESCAESPTLWCGGSPATMIWALAGLRIVDLHGRDVLPRFFRELLDQSPPESFDDMRDRQFEAFAAAAGADVGCYADRWKWQLSDAARARMSSEYGPNALCADGDGDGDAPVDGDLDDTNPMVSLHAVEMSNGIDDDCNGIVDDILVEEGTGAGGTAFEVSIPARVSGMISSKDERDEIHFEVEGSSFGVEARAFEQPVVLWWEGYGGSPLLPGADMYATVVDPPVSSGRWTLAFTPSGFHGGLEGGRYEVTVFEVRGRVPWSQARLESQTASTCRVTLSIIDARASEPADSVRLWVSGVGYVDSVPTSDEVAFEWQRIEGTQGVVDLRGQLFLGDQPASNLSAPVACGTLRTRPARR